MLGFLAAVGFLVFIIFGIMWIVSLIKKNGKAVRNVLIAVVGFIVFIGSTAAGIGGLVNEAVEDMNDEPEKVEETEEVNASDNNAEENENENNNDNDENEEEEIEEEEFGIGDEVELDGQVVEVTEIEKSSGDDFEKPKDGNEFVIVHVSIENNGDDEISYNPFNFKMQNSNGQIEDQGLTIIDSDTALSSGDLAPGGDVSGTLAFEQEIDDDGLELIFEPGFWSTDEITFDLSE